MARKEDGLRELVEAGIQPRGLSLQQAAAYLSVSIPTFRALVASGRIPDAMPGMGKRRIWDRAAIDAALGGTREAPSDDRRIDDALEKALSQAS
jgi:excisionase family DNA binding protein